MIAQTDARGGFIFTNLGPGNYYLEAVGDTRLYDPVTEQVMIVRGARVTLTLYLREKRAGAPETRPGGTVSAVDIDQGVPEAAKNEFERGAKLSAEGKPEKAIEHLKKAVEIHPNYSAARSELGVQYLKLKRHGEATEHLNTAIEINPKAFSPKLYLGIALIELKKYPEAVASLNEAIGLNGTQPDAHLYLGIAYLGAGDFTAAEQALTKALALGGEKYALPHYYAAYVHIKKGNRQDAIKELSSYVKKAPDGERAAHARTLMERLKTGS
jgi:tetratricopeptide (TPR) repeat protein